MQNLLKPYYDKIKAACPTACGIGIAVTAGTKDALGERDPEEQDKFISVAVVTFQSDRDSEGPVVYTPDIKASSGEKINGEPFAGVERWMEGKTFFVEARGHNLDDALAGALDSYHTWVANDRKFDVTE
jgi:hypothetical protein